MNNYTVYRPLTFHRQLCQLHIHIQRIFPVLEITTINHNREYYKLIQA